MIRGVFRHREIPPGFVDPAAYGVGAAFDKAERLLEISDWRRGPRRFWNTTLSAEGWYGRMLFAVARHILRRGELTGTQNVSYPGISMYITFPPELKAGDRVSWLTDPNDCGTVTKTDSDSNWIVIRWDKGHTGKLGRPAMMRIVRALGSDPQPKSPA